MASIKHSLLRFFLFQSQHTISLEDSTASRNLPESKSTSVVPYISITGPRLTLRRDLYTQKPKRMAWRLLHNPPTCIAWFPLASGVSVQQATSRAAELCSSHPNKFVLEVQSQPQNAIKLNPKAASLNYIGRNCVLCGMFICIACFA